LISYGGELLARALSSLTLRGLPYTYLYYDPVILALLGLCSLSVFMYILSFFLRLLYSLFKGEDEFLALSSKATLCLSVDF